MSHSTILPQSHIGAIQPHDSYPDATAPVPHSLFPLTSKKHLPIEATTSASAPSANKGDIRTYLKPRSDSQQTPRRFHAAPNGGTSNVSSPPGFSAEFPARTTSIGTNANQASFFSSQKLAVTDLTSDGQADIPVRRPTKLLTYGQELGPQGPRKLHDTAFGAIKQPRECTRKPQVVLPRAQKRPFGRPRNYLVPAGVSIERLVRLPEKSVRGQENIFLEPSGPAIISSSLKGPCEPDHTGNKGATKHNSTLNLTGVLTSAFSHNATTDLNSRYQSEQENDLVGALASAFASNAIPDDFNDSSDFSWGSDSESLEHPKRRRRRRLIAHQRVPQIPASPVLKRLHQERSREEPSVPPSEKTIQEYLEVEYSSVHLPPGVSVALENDSEYVDPDDELLLDYNSSAEIVETRREQEQSKKHHAPKVLMHNLRFIMKKQAEISTHGIHQSNAVRQYIVATVPSTAVFVQHVEDNCSDRALNYVWANLSDWESNPKPRKYRSRIQVGETYSKYTTPSESSDVVEEDKISVTQTVKRLEPANDSGPRKRVKFSDEVADTAQSVVPSGDEYSEFNAILCGELLQKLVKGKVKIAAQELENVLSFMKNPLLEYMAKIFQRGDDLDFLSTISRQAFDCIWRSLQYIAQSAFGALGLPEIIERTLKWEAQRIVNSERN